MEAIESRGTGKIAVDLTELREHNFTKSMRVLLVANYLADQQESMLRYAEMIRRDLHGLNIKVEVIRPQRWVGRLVSTRVSFGKWLGYFDKFVIFPFQLRQAVKRVPGLVVHICDHSNAMYTSLLQDIPHVVTCHDLLAVRSALGQFSTNNTGWSGRRLQAWIQWGLRRASRILCVSNATRRDLLALEPSAASRAVTIYPALNYNYKPMDSLAARSHLASIPKLLSNDTREFLFHVGGNQWYKNRSGLLRIYFSYIRQGGHLPLVMAGKPFNDELRQLLKAAPARAKVLEIGNVANDTLNALYAKASALLFPSMEEGFGWPVLEALAVGCPVICSQRASLPEVGGDAAIYIDPENEEDAAKILLAALNAPEKERHARKELGFRHANRFNDSAISAIVDNYKLVYDEYVALRDHIPMT